MKLKTWIWDSTLHLSDTSFNKVCDGYADGLHVIGECKTCEFGRQYRTMEDNTILCSKPRPHPIRDFTLPKDFGCIHWEKKK